VLCVHDDEDSGRRIEGQDFSLSFRVWRILDGGLSEHADRLFSPFQSPHAFGDILIQRDTDENRTAD